MRARSSSNSYGAEACFMRCIIFASAACSRLVIFHSGRSTRDRFYRHLGYRLTRVERPLWKMTKRLQAADAKMGTSMKQASAPYELDDDLGAHRLESVCTRG